MAGRNTIWNFKLSVVFLKFLVFFSKPLDTAGCVDEFLFTREKRMTFGTNFHADILACGSHLDDISAGTRNRGRLIIGMRVGFHLDHFPLNYSEFLTNIYFNATL
jgi:hypothetical protein